MTPDYELMFRELIGRMTEEELIRMIRRSERNVGENPLSLYLRNEVNARRKADMDWESYRPGIAL